MSPLRKRMIEDMTIRNLSPRTIGIYVREVGKLAKHFGRSPGRLGPQEIREYQVHVVKGAKISWSLFNVMVCALRFFYTITLGMSWAVERINYAKQPKKRPVILSQEEVCRVLEGASNVKAHTILATIYATGVRVSEATHLAVSDIDSCPASSTSAVARARRIATSCSLRDC